MYKEQAVTIACSGCGRTQTLRKSKLVSCDGYACGCGSCKQNPQFKLPEAPTGSVRHELLHAAGAFFGWKICKATKDELRAGERAKAIRDAGMKQLADERVRKLLDF